MSISLQRAPKRDYLEHGKREPIDMDGYQRSSGYSWVFEISIWRFHLLGGFAARGDYWRRHRLWCLLHGGHKKQINNPVDPARRYWCPECGTVWPE